MTTIDGPLRDVVVPTDPPPGGPDRRVPPQVHLGSGPAVLWLATATAGVLAGVGPSVLLSASLLVAVALGRGRFVPSAAHALMGAVGTAALLGPEWLLAGATLALVVVAHAGGGPRLPARIDDVELHIARCRRAGSTADVVLAACADHAGARELANTLRRTDSAAVVGSEVRAVVSREDLHRTALEARVSGTSVPAFGWARFPEDGLTASALVSAARSDLGDRQRASRSSGTPGILLAPPTAASPAHAHRAHSAPPRK